MSKYITTRFALFVAIAITLTSMPAMAFSEEKTIPAAYPANITSETAMSVFSQYPSVRNQGSFSTGWAQAITGAAEFDLIKTCGKTNVDLSEMYLASGIYKNLDTPTLPKSDVISKITYTGSDKDMLKAGGNLWYAGQFLMKGYGFINENEMPNITTPTSSAFNSSGNIRQNISYLHKKDVAHLKNMMEYDMSDENGVREVKEAIMEHGSVAAVYHRNATFYNPLHNSYCAKGDVLSNHTALIVGWDDNYSSENFLTTTTGNGAWLIRDSFGGGNDFNGYFWLSYHDPGLSPYVFVFDAGDITYDNNYFYDAQFHSSTYFVNNFKTANVYTAQKNETLTEVSLEIAEPTGYSIAVYTDPSDADPESGTLKIAVTGEFRYPGMYTVPIKEVPLKKGQKFSIVVALENRSVIFEQPTANWPNATAYGGIKTGQSFIYSDNEWNDFTTWGYNGNFIISAHTVNRNDPEEPVITDPVAPSPSLEPDYNSESETEETEDPKTPAPTSPEASTPSEGETESLEENKKDEEKTVPAKGNEENKNEDKETAVIEEPAKDDYTEEKKKEEKASTFSAQNSEGATLTVFYDVESDTYLTSDGQQVLVFGSTPRYCYTGDKITPGKDSYVMWGDILYKDEKDYKIRFKKNKKTGLASASLTWKKGSRPYLLGGRKSTLNFTIKKRHLDESNVQYSASSKTITATFEDKTVALKKKDYSVSRLGNNIYIKFKGNYSGKLFIAD